MGDFCTSTNATVALGLTGELCLVDSMGLTMTSLTKLADTMVGSFKAPVVG